MPTEKIDHRDKRLTVAYVGPNMNLAHAAYAAAHTEAKHKVAFFNVNEFRSANDWHHGIVVVAPLVPQTGSVAGPCYLSTFLPETTLIVAIGIAQGASHAMWVKHALEGRCHARIVIHYPTGRIDPKKFVDSIEQLANADTTSGERFYERHRLPAELSRQVDGASQDLGQMMEARRFRRILDEAAKVDDEHEWESWADLAKKVGVTPGTLKNHVAEFGRIAAASGLLTSQNATGIRVASFVRFAISNRWFIWAYMHHVEREVLE